MINFYELFNLTFKTDSLTILFDLICSFVIFVTSYYLIFVILLKDKDAKLQFKGKILIKFIIFMTITIMLIFFSIKGIEKLEKEKFYKIAKMNKLNINYDNFILENKKLKNFCKTINEERKYLLYSKYNNDFCKIENGDVNSDTINKVFNELYSTSNNKNKTKNKAVEEAIQFIKEKKIQIKIDNKMKGEKRD